MYKILVIDDDKAVSTSIRKVLNKIGITDEASDGNSAKELIVSNHYDLVLCDIKLPDISGLDILKFIKARSDKIIVIIITGYGSIEGAVEAIKLGAYDYIEKPVQIEILMNLVKNALKLKEIETEITELKGIKYNIFTQNNEMRKIIDQAIQTAPYIIPVLITGETGTGKELIARAIHNNGPRAQKRFYAVNCGAIPRDLLESEFFGFVKGAFTGATMGKKGIFEAANESTLFLDEVDALSLDMQVKFLRVLQEGTVKQIGSNEEIKVDVRIISATSADLELKIKEDLFRADLYYRLNAVKIKVMPLRERKDDIQPLSQYFADNYCKSINKPCIKLTNEVLEIFLRYDWPGNVRELKHSIERAVIMTKTDEIKPDDLAENFLKIKIEPFLENELDYKKNFNIVKDRFDKEIIKKALSTSKNNISNAAKLLGISRRNLQYKMKEFNIGQN